MARFEREKRGLSLSTVSSLTTIPLSSLSEIERGSMKPSDKDLQSLGNLYGYPNALLDDFRRTAVRNLERAGVPRSTAKIMVGHKTDAIYQRYAIQDEAMLREGAAKLAAWNEELKAKAAAERRGQLRRFKNSKC